MVGIDEKREPETPVCNCGRPELLARDPNFPVEFDTLTNEYHVTNAPNRFFRIMRYCFWCGGRLPESTRHRLFTTPNPQEVANVSELLKPAKSVAVVLQILGDPDETFEGTSGVGDPDLGPSGDAARKYVRYYRYSTRWETFTLDVCERPDGLVEYIFAGKYIGNQDDLGE